MNNSPAAQLSALMQHEILLCTTASGLAHQKTLGSDALQTRIPEGLEVSFAIRPASGV